jgi:hypothetical protein
MASFTDAISQFNPYVQQLPLEAMLQVGTYKQQKYEQGVQKIQGQIDRVAGLDIVRDVDKQYLQSKLNELGSKLKTVAGGDFSNFQLVNSVGGMASQIGKDDNVTNAVSSTAKYRRGLTDMEDAKKAGKSAPSNEYVFKKSASDWMTSTDLKKGFSDTYDPYTNWKKESLELLKNLTKDSTITEDMFTTNSKGQMVLADVTTRNKFAGISPERIQEALLVGLTPAAFKQMQTDGLYTYANKSAEDFQSELTNSLKDKMDYFNGQRTALESAKNNTNSGIQRQKLDDQIKSLDKTMTSVTSKYTGLLDSLKNGNVDGVKASLFTEDQILGFAKAFSFTEVEQEYKQNYAAEMAFKREESNKAWLKWKMEFEQEEKWKGLEYDLKKSKELRKIKEGKDAAEGPMYGGLPQGIEQDKLMTVREFNDKVSQNKKTIEDSDYTFAQKYNPNPSKPFTKQQADAFVAEQRQMWQKGKADIKISTHFNQTEEMRMQNKVADETIADIERKAKNKTYVIDGKAMNGADMSTILPTGTTGLAFTTSSGRKLSFTPEELVEFNAKRAGYISSTGGSPGAPGVVSVDYNKARNELSDKEYTLFNIFAKTSKRTPSDEIVVKKVQQIGQAAGANYNKLINAQREFKSTELANRVTTMQGMNYSFPIANPLQKTALANALVKYADLADSQKGGLPNSPKFSSADLRKIVPEIATANMTVAEGTPYAPAMYEITASGKDGVSTKFKVTPEQKATMFGDLFEAPPAVQAFRPIQNIIRSRGWGSTSSTPGKTTWNNATLSKIYFPNVQSFGINANVDEVSPGQYSIRVNINNPLTKETLSDLAWPKNSLATEGEVIRYMQALNDITAFELLNDRSPSEKELKQIQQAKNNPF